MIGYVCARAAAVQEFSRSFRRSDSSEERSGGGSTRSAAVQRQTRTLSCVPSLRMLRTALESLQPRARVEDVDQSLDGVGQRSGDAETSHSDGSSNHKTWQGAWCRMQGFVGLAGGAASEGIPIQLITVPGHA